MQQSCAGSFPREGCSGPRLGFRRTVQRHARAERVSHGDACSAADSVARPPPNPRRRTARHHGLQTTTRLSHPARFARLRALDGDRRRIRLGCLARGCVLRALGTQTLSPSLRRQISLVAPWKTGWSTGIRWKVFLPGCVCLAALWSTAYAAQALLALAAAAAVIVAWRGRASTTAKGAVLAVASLLFSPFLLEYDLVLLAIPIAWLTGTVRATASCRGEGFSRPCMVGSAGIATDRKPR